MAEVVNRVRLGYVPEQVEQFGEIENLNLFTISFRSIFLCVFARSAICFRNMTWMLIISVFHKEPVFFYRKFHQEKEISM